MPVLDKSTLHEIALIKRSLKRLSPHFDARTQYHNHGTLNWSLAREARADAIERRADERVKAIITSIGMRQQLCGVAYHNDLECGVIFYEQGRPRNIVARY
jgi:hypothetical protein